MKKEVKIILTSGISITISDKDKTVIDVLIDGMAYDVNKIEDIKKIPAIIMNAEDDIVIHHNISTGEFMEYYLTRDKITWCYYSEVPEKDGE